MDIPKEAMAMVSFRHPADDSNAGTWNQKNGKNAGIWNQKNGKKLS